MVSTENKTIYTRISQIWIDNLRGVFTGAQYFKLILNERTSAVKIWDKIANDWTIRFDGPHQNYPYPHININKKVRKLPDPHTPISSTTLKASEQVGKVCKEVNKVLLSTVIAYDVYKIGWSAFVDYKQGTSRNTTTTISSIAGSWTGVYAGTKIGVTTGWYFSPVFGTQIGAFFGGVTGGIAGSFGGEIIANIISDTWKHDISDLECDSCKRIHECRRYDKTACAHCSNCNVKAISLKSLHKRWRQTA